MQGTLTEIDLRSILQLIERGQRTGKLLTLLMALTLLALGYSSICIATDKPLRRNT